MKAYAFAAAICVLAATLSAPANADDWRHGLYIKGNVGLAYSRDQEYNDTTDVVNTDLKNGYTVQGAVGYDYGMVRSEIELGYRQNDVDGHVLNGTAVTNPDGKADSWSGMVNGYIDIPTDTVITPYVGAGIGFARVNADGYVGNSADIVDDGDTSFAYQGMLGLDFAFDDAWSLFTEYRYFAVDNVKMRDANNETIDVDYDSHTISAGLRYSFK